MVELDLDSLPIGQRGWQEFVDSVSGIDDTAERNFLELKSDVNLNSKEGYAKVAKFVLGAANRDPEVAAKRLGGHALMVIGVDKNGAPGVPFFEAKDLYKEAAKFLGTPGPKWDHNIVPIGQNLYVVIIVVDPPDVDHQPWICKSDGGYAGLKDGKVFLRVEGETREASGHELEAIIARVKRLPAKVDLEVQVIGAAIKYDCDVSVLESYLSAVSQDLLDAYPEPKPPVKEVPIGPAGGPFGYMAIPDMSKMMPLAHAGIFGDLRDDRTREAYIAEIAAWQIKCRADWLKTLDRIASGLSGVAIRVINKTKTYLPDVKVNVHVDGPVEGIKHRRMQDIELDKILPAPPRKWGPISMSEQYSPAHLGLGGLRPNVRRSASDFKMVRFRNGDSVEFQVRFEEIRPDETDTSDNDDVVLVLRDHSIKELSGTWRATVKGHDAVYEGELNVAIDDRVFDFKPFIERLAAE